MSILSCCRQLLKRYSDRHRAVLCKRWVAPVRFITLFSLAAHICWRAVHPVQFYTFLLIIIHIVIALLLLAECRRSEIYHKTIEEFERRATVIKESEHH